MGGDLLLDEQTYVDARADEFISERAKAAGLSRRRFLQILTAGGACGSRGRVRAAGRRGI
jgi:hypothetical protein